MLRINISPSGYFALRPETIDTTDVEFDAMLHAMLPMARVDELNTNIQVCLHNLSDAAPAGHC